MPGEMIAISVLSIAAGIFLILAIVFAALYFRGKKRDGTYADGVKIIDGVRYSKDDSIETDGAAKITHRKGDFLLESGKTYTAVKNGSLLPGSYTVLASSDSAVSFKLRIGGYVRNYSHGDTIVLADGDQVCAVSCNVILR